MIIKFDYIFSSNDWRILGKTCQCRYVICTSRLHSIISCIIYSSTKLVFASNDWFFQVNVTLIWWYNKSFKKKNFSIPLYCSNLVFEACRVYKLIEYYELLTLRSFQSTSIYNANNMQFLSFTNESIVSIKKVETIMKVLLMHY